MPPIIIKEECNACGICADICPTDVFRIANKGDIPEIKYPEECWHCNACVLDCKPSEIKLEKKQSVPGIGNFIVKIPGGSG